MSLYNQIDIPNEAICLRRVWRTVPPTFCSESRRLVKGGQNEVENPLHQLRWEHVTLEANIRKGVGPARYSGQRPQFCGKSRWHHERPLVLRRRGRFLIGAGR